MTDTVRRIVLLAFFLCSLHGPGFMILLFLLHVIDVLVYSIAKLLAVVQPVSRNQSDASKEFVVPPGFHQVPLSLGWVAMNHGYSQPLPNVAINGQQLLAEDIEVASALLSIFRILLCCFVEGQIVVGLSPDNRVYLLQPFLWIKGPRLLCFGFNLLPEVLPCALFWLGQEVEFPVFLPLSPVPEGKSQKVEVIFVEVH